MARESASVPFGQSPVTPTSTPPPAATSAGSTTNWRDYARGAYEFAGQQGTGAGDAGVGSTQSAPPAYAGGQGATAVHGTNAPGHVSAAPVGPNAGQTLGAVPGATASGSDPHSRLGLDDSLLRNAAAAGLMTGLLARRAKKDEQPSRKEAKEEKKESSKTEDKKDSSKDE